MNSSSRIFFVGQVLLGLLMGGPTGCDGQRVNPPGTEQSSGAKSTEKYSRVLELNQFIVSSKRDEDLIVGDGYCDEYPCTFEWQNDFTDDDDVMISYEINITGYVIGGNRGNPSGFCETSHQPYDSTDNIVWRAVSSVVADGIEACPISAGGYNFTAPNKQLVYYSDEPLPCNNVAIHFDMFHRGRKRKMATGQLFYNSPRGTYEPTCPDFYKK
ncbi:uncharacterized protein LOC135170817 [Diachasmimorpha longicaudata]|uniref:uncharacterized protein LOC135170817 n=1 Tax=Diachasmimorpha longicaudata TaxID=58733 RepID=UPI0030B8E4ED